MPQGPKLRARPPDPPFHVVLVQPEIPPNVGAVGRTCVATGSVLHLVGPIRFDLSERAVRRAGLDYWPHLRLHVHEDWEAFVRAQPGRRLHLFSGRARRSYLEADLRPGDALVFGKESTGLPDELLARYAEHSWAIPLLGPVRSLNVASAVAVVLYEALRRCGALRDCWWGEPR